MTHFLPHGNFDDLLAELVKQGYHCIGPQVQNGVITFADLNSAAQLPWGIQEIQSPGQYRLHKTDRAEAFAWANGPQAIKPILFKPRESLWRVERDESGKLIFKEVIAEIKPTALIGVRSCDLAAMAIQDKVFIEDVHQDQRYKSQREKLFIIVVNCSYSGGNCFCVSTQTGPKATSGFDLALTEIDGGFVLEVGTDRGQQLIDQLQLRISTSEQINTAETNVKRAANMQTKRMPKNNSRELLDILMNNLGHDRWDDVAERCLSCGNCTLVCPTCFCHHETETPALDGTSSLHSREWDSCFSAGHSYSHKKVIREDTKSRYKQWLTHKLGTWWEQFDSSGCIGCGRCITWCPVGIDITEEMAAISGGSNIVGSAEKE